MHNFATATHKLIPLFFRKKKPFLSDLIPNNFVDIHSHLLPGIDDGAKTLEETVFLIKGLTDLGFEQFITTPHVMTNVWENTSAGIQLKWDETLSALKNEAIDTSFRAGAEYLMDGNFVELFKSEPLLVIKDKHVLVEMSYINPPIQLFDIIFDLQIAGYIPVLAHPERYTFYQSNPEMYTKLKDAGCLFQLNLLSTVGYYGTGVLKSASDLLKNGLIDFVGSDVHHKKHLEAFGNKVLLKDTKALTAAIANNQFFRI